MSPPRDAAAACPLNSIDRQQVETQRKSVRQSSDRPAGWGTTSPLWSCQRKGSTDKLLSVEDSKTQISLKWTKTRSFFCISTTFFLYSILHWISRQTHKRHLWFFFYPKFFNCNPSWDFNSKTLHIQLAKPSISVHWGGDTPSPPPCTNTKSRPVTSSASSTASTHIWCVPNLYLTDRGFIQLQLII